MHFIRGRTSLERERESPLLLSPNDSNHADFQGLVLCFKLGSTSVLIKYLPAKQLKCWLRSQCEAWASVVCAPGSLRLLRLGAHSIVVSPKGPLKREERQGTIRWEAQKVATHCSQYPWPSVHILTVNNNQKTIYRVWELQKVLHLLFG